MNGEALPQTDAAPRPDAAGDNTRLHAIRQTSTVWYWEQDADFRFTVDVRGRDQESLDGSVIGIRRWEANAEPLQGTWEDHKRCLEAREPFRDFEFRVGHGADAIYISTTGVPVYAADGTFIGYRGTAMDITVLVKAREQSERARAFAVLASRLGRVAAWTYDVPTRKASWSEEFVRLLRLPPGSTPTVGDVFGLVHRRIQPELDSALKACVRAGTPFDLEVLIFTVAGERLWMRLYGESVRDAKGAITHVQGAAQDINESKNDREHLRLLGTELAAANAGLASHVRERTRELELANAELKGFAHALAHDLKQPITTVKWFAQALRDAVAKGDARRVQHMSERIQAAGLRMEEYVDALLSLAQTSQAPLTMAQVDLSEVAAAVLGELQAGDPARRVVCTIEPGLRARGDRRLLRMLLQNLLGNAWKFSSNVAEARLSLTSRTGERGETVYVVQDNGAGFDMAYAGKLFGSFQRLHTTQEFDGTGIGLANAHRIVTRHGGRIWGESRVGEGASFSFTLGGDG